MRRRKSRWPSFRWSYKRAFTLHKYEEELVLALVAERGGASVRAWCELEPGRWDAVYLTKVFRRLYEKGLVERTRQHYPGLLGRRSSWRYTPQTRREDRERVRTH